MRQTILLAGAIVLAILVLYPLFWLIAGSIGLTQGVSFRYFQAAFTTTDLVVPLVNTLVLAGWVAVWAPIIAVPLAWLVARSDLPGRTTIEFLVYLSFIFPSFLSAIAFVLLFGPGAGLINRLAVDLLGFDSSPFNIFSFTGIVIVTVMHVYPFVFLLTLNGLRSLNPSFEDAARIHGATSYGTVMRVVLPIVAPSIFAGVLLAMVDAVALFGIQAILGGPRNIETLATKVYDLSGFPANPEQASALSMIMVGFAALALYAQGWFLGKRSYVTVSGKGARMRRSVLGRWRIPILVCVSAFFFFCLVLPIAVLLTVSFLSSVGGGLSFGNLTLSNYSEVLTMSLARRAMYNSIVFGAVAASISVVLGFVVAYTDIRTNVWWRRALDYVSLIPLGLPGIVLGVAMVLAWSQPIFSLYGTAWIIILAYVTRFTPLTARTLNSALVQVHENLEKAARISGASWLRTQLAITVPLLRTALFIAWLLAFVQSLRELSASILLYSRGKETLAIAIFNIYDEGSFPQTCALAMVTLAVTLLAVAIARRVGQGSWSEAR